MKVQCGQCPAKYAVSDERIQDKKVRIHCKRCGASIVVDGKVDPPLVTSTPARKSARPPGAPSDSPPPPPPPPEREPDSRPSPRPVAHTIMGGLEAPAAERLQRTRSSPPPRPIRSPASPLERDDEPPTAEAPPGARGLPDPQLVPDENRWRVALTKQDLRWMTTGEIVEAFHAGGVKLETFVFRAGMPTWVTLLEVPEIAQALSAAGVSASAISSLPPPRKLPSRPDSDEDSAFAALDDLDAVEPLPFALVAERANGGRSESMEGEQAPPAPLTRAAEAPQRLEPVLRPSTVPEDMGHSASIPFAAAQQASGSSRWVWVAVVLLLLGAAAAFLAPRYGLEFL
jgi:predicted Zn finger-like uncharacterized protein